jgi:hypothetical protein
MAPSSVLHGGHFTEKSCVKKQARLGYRDTEIFFARAVALDNLGRPGEALANCTAAAKIDPKRSSLTAWADKIALRGLGSAIVRFSLREVVDRLTSTQRAFSPSSSSHFDQEAMVRLRIQPAGASGPAQL